MYFHESNIIGKINSRKYEYAREELEKLYEEEYKNYRTKLEELNFMSEDEAVFKYATELINEYLIKVKKVEKEQEIKSQSKLRSSFLEEISTYLFKDLQLIKEGHFIIHNKNIYAGMKINNQMHIDMLSKDVDFCIGKNVVLKVDDTTQELPIIMPVVCVEVKTYLDATMFGEVQFSSRQIKNASPNVKTYVLMEYNDVADEKIIAARYDNNLNEMFVLRSGSRRTDNPLNPRPLDYKALLQYYKEISSSVEHTDVEDTINATGKLLDRCKKEM